MVEHVQASGVWCKHECTNFVSIGQAAKAAGVPYQYVFGLVQRSLRAKRPKVTACQEQQPYTGRLKWAVCADCVGAVYGSAAVDQADLMATPRQGYRGWRIKGDKLVSWYDSEFPWNPGETVATCGKSHREGVPGRRCSCGLYAKDRAIDAVAYARNNNIVVVGAVQLWGRNRGEAAHAYRAQYGRVAALLCSDWLFADEIHRIAGVYDIPVTHNVATLQNTDWGVHIQQQDEFARLAEGGTDGHWQREGVRGTGTSAPQGEVDTGTAACRVAARGAAEGAYALQELRRLYKEGVISESNVAEIVMEVTHE